MHQTLSSGIFRPLRDEFMIPSTTEILILGGGTGGVAAALAACEMGARVVMTEPTAWIGGQLTQQAVPPDENRWIESSGATYRYRRFRDNVREFYRRHYPLVPEARRRWLLNPGNGAVSRLCHESRVAVSVLETMLQPFIASGRLIILRGFEPVAAEVQNDRLQSVTIRETETGRDFDIAADYFLDATETGDVLPLAGAEYVTGFESRKMTGEPSAPEDYQPQNMQAISWCFTVDHFEGEDHVIEKPRTYDFWREYVPPVSPSWGSPLLSWSATHPRTLEPEVREFLPNIAKRNGDMNLWTFRRIIDREMFSPGFFGSDIVLINWPQIDYLPGSIIDVPNHEREQHLEGARQLSLSMLYWMQTEAPRHDGSSRFGYPGLRLRSDVTGNGPDGLALHPYIRESRRIQARFTVCEQHIATAIRGEHGAERFADSIGLGHYRIDLHPSTGGNNYIDVEACPFQIPLGSLVPVRLQNLLPASKNLGVTHITNGCYRLHPVEWNIGEVAGILAVHCMKNGSIPAGVLEDQKALADFQGEISRQGVLIDWSGSPTPVPMEDW